MRIARVYDATGGRRVLVDRLWPRGLTKEEADLAAWAKELAPSHALRKAFHAGLPRDAFEAAYAEELEGQDLAVLAGPDTVLVSAAKEAVHAQVLAKIAQKGAISPGKSRNARK